MTVVLKDEIRSARKVYNCDAFAWWCSGGFTLEDCQNDDQRLIVQASEADKGKILVAQKYRYIRGVFEGQMFTWRGRVGMDSVCRDLGLYEDE